MSGGNVCHFWSVTLRVNILFTDMVIPEGWDEMKPLSSDMGKRKNTRLYPKASWSQERITVIF